MGLYVENGVLKQKDDGERRVITNSDRTKLFDLDGDDGDNIYQFKGETDDPEVNPDMIDTANGNYTYLSFNSDSRMILKSVAAAGSECNTCDKLDEIIEKIGKVQNTEEEQTIILSNGWKAIG